MSATHTATLCISHTHPSLPGHFPGQPIVPGVVLLDRVLSTAQTWLGRPVQLQTLQQAKFITPLLPDEEAQMQLRLQGSELRFTITRSGTRSGTRGGEMIAQGLLSLSC